MTHAPEPSTFLPEPTSPQAVWHWRFEDAAGAEVDAASASPSPRFPSQSDAESWVGEAWRTLVEDGVAGVTLFEADRRVYGPMSLRPA
jgi:hypothetical protein